MKRISNKVYTDFIIYNENDRTSNHILEAELAEEHYNGIWNIVQKGIDELHKQNFYKNLSSSKGIKLDSFFAVRTIESAANGILKEACGGAPNFEDYPDRPNGGKWYAMGNCYPADYDWNNNTYHEYIISGECENTLCDYCGLKMLKMCDFDCSLGATHSGYCGDSVKLKHKMNGQDVMKTLYAIHIGDENSLPIINTHCFENIDGLKKLGFLSNDKRNKVICDVPVITMNDRRKMYELCQKYADMLSEVYHDEIMKLMKNPVELPSHLKSVPNGFRYMNCRSTFSMRVIMNAHENGLFLPDRNLKDSPVPAVFLAISE